MVRVIEGQESPQFRFLPMVWESTLVMCRDSEEVSSFLEGSGSGYQNTVCRRLICQIDLIIPTWKQNLRAEIYKDWSETFCLLYN